MIFRSFFDYDDVARAGHETFEQLDRILIDGKQRFFLRKSNYRRCKFIPDAVAHFTVPQLVVNNNRNGVDLSRSLSRISTSLFLKQENNIGAVRSNKKRAFFISGD